VKRHGPPDAVHKQRWSNSETEQHTSCKGNLSRLLTSGLMAKQSKLEEDLGRRSCTMDENREEGGTQSHSLTSRSWRLADGGLAWTLTMRRSRRRRCPGSGRRWRGRETEAELRLRRAWRGTAVDRAHGRARVAADESRCGWTLASVTREQTLRCWT
jgi:hypothetical protein